MIRVLVRTAQRIGGQRELLRGRVQHPLPRHVQPPLLRQRLAQLLRAHEVLRRLVAVVRRLRAVRLGLLRRGVQHRRGALVAGQGHRVLYYENIEGGHGGAADNVQRAKMCALEYNFLWSTIGGSAKL